MKLFTQIDETQWQFLLNYIKPKVNRLIFAQKYDYKWSGFFKRQKVFPKNLAQISQYCLSDFKSKERWECKQIFSTNFFKFSLDQEVWDFIFSKERLNDWNKYYKTPEDPSFYNNETPILETISHEGFVTVFFDKKDWALFENNGFTKDEIEEDN